MIKKIFIACSVLISLLAAQSPIPAGAKLQLLKSGFSLGEGPYWHPEGYLLFSDVSTNKIHKWSADSGVTLYISPSGNSNGISADLNGNLLLCQHSARQLGRMNSDKSITPLATHYEGKRLHSPNDLAVKSDGAIFFTDPPWGGNPSEMNFHGVYRLPPGGGTIQLLEDNISYPNGIAFSPDEMKVYISDSGGKHVYVYDVVDDSTLANKTLFKTLSGTQAADGMKIDSLGNLYVSGSLGVVIYSSTGVLLDNIDVPGDVTNLAWGGANGRVLFITTFQALYMLEMNEPVNEIPGVKKNTPYFKLQQNYPNPFNPNTTIEYEISKSGKVKIELFDTSGKKLMDIMDKVQAAGIKSVNVNLSHLTSGIYFYTLTFNNSNATRKMLLVR